MGDVKEAVKGSGKKDKGSQQTLGKNLIVRLSDISDELGEHVTKKDEETESEGASERAENKRKSAILRAAFSLVRSAKQILEDY